MRSTGRTLILPLLLLFLFSPLLLGALEVTEGKIKLILHEGTGRFSLYTLNSDEEYVPLFVAQDPRTSGITLVVDDRIVKLGESGDYREEVLSTPEGASFSWISSTLRITQEFEFVSTAGSSSPDGLKITITLTNGSDRSLEAGLRLLLDTYLGEEGTPHFKTDRHPEISRELTVLRDNMIRYWVSHSSRYPEINLQCLTAGAEITIPDRIVFANWKRLNDTSWAYETSRSRNFNLLPYSINDSAVSHYYDPQPIDRGGNRKIITVLGSFAPGQSVLSLEGKLMLNELLQETAETTDPEQAASSPNTDLELINKFIKQLSERLSSEEEITAEELKLMREVLQGLKDRVGRYQEGR